MTTNLNPRKLVYGVTKWSQWVISQWVCSVKSRPSVHLGLFLLRVSSFRLDFFFNGTRILVCFCFVSYVFLAEFLLREMNLYLLQRYSTVFSFFSGAVKKIKGLDQQLIHCLGLDPECKHRRRADTDFTLLIGMEYRPQLCFDPVSPFCTVGSSQGKSLTKFPLLMSG